MESILPLMKKRCPHARIRSAFRVKVIPEQEQRRQKCLQTISMVSLSTKMTDAQLRWRTFIRSKEIMMLRNRLIHMLTMAAVVLVTSLTVREAFATVVITSQADSAIMCDSLPSRYSIHPKIVEEIGIVVLYSEDGPVGVDGGLRELMSAYRNCSR
jgi:hypothetical protein